MRCYAPHSKKQAKKADCKKFHEIHEIHEIHKIHKNINYYKNNLYLLFSDEVMNERSE